MTDEQIEAMSMREMRKLEQRLNIARLNRTRKLWAESGGKRSVTVGKLVEFRDKMEAEGK